jgi:hypothetical protein
VSKTADAAGSGLDWKGKDIRESLDGRVRSRRSTEGRWKGKISKRHQGKLGHARDVAADGGPPIALVLEYIDNIRIQFISMDGKAALISSLPAPR